MTGFQIRRAADRAVTSTDWLESRHSFAFGAHYEPDNVGFGPLIALNADVVQPGPGYLAHRHAGLEILTWVVDGVLEHQATETTEVRAGQLQYLSVGTGIEHAERSADDHPVTVVQMWLTGEVKSESLYVVEQIPIGSLVLAASSHRPAPIVLQHAQAELYIGRPVEDDEIELPATDLHLYVVSGTIDVDGQSLQPGDALRGQAKRLRATTDAEVLAWSL